MIRGIGVDAVEIERIEEALGRHDGRMKVKLFTEAERAYCEARNRPGAHYAARFAAKEAFSKAIGTGFSRGLSWREISVVNLDSGKPEMHLSGVAATLLAEARAKHVHVSLSHSRGLAVAVVAIED